MGLSLETHDSVGNLITDLVYIWERKIPGQDSQYVLGKTAESLTGMTFPNALAGEKEMARSKGRMSSADHVFF